MAISLAASRTAPLLEHEQERDLLRKWQTGKDRQALETLILSHARLVFAWAVRLGTDASEREELAAEGFVGLIRAADAFDLGKDVRFSTYAKYWVANAMRSAGARMRSVIDTPDRVGDQPTGFSVLDSRRGRIEAEAMERVHSPELTPEERLIQRSTRDRLRRQIVEAMAELGDLEREVIVCRTLRAEPDTIEDLSVRLNLSRDKLRQVERRAMSRLKFGLLARGVTSTQMG